MRDRSSNCSRQDQAALALDPVSDVPQPFRLGNAFWVAQVAGSPPALVRFSPEMRTTRDVATHCKKRTIAFLRKGEHGEAESKNGQIRLASGLDFGVVQLEGL
jgi:hypothetical protein